MLGKRFFSVVIVNVLHKGKGLVHTKSLEKVQHTASAQSYIHGLSATLPGWPLYINVLVLYFQLNFNEHIHNKISKCNKITDVIKKPSLIYSKKDVY